MAEGGTAEQQHRGADPDARTTDRFPEVPDTPELPPPTRTRVVLLGAGEPGRELVRAFQRLGAEVVAVDSHADAPLRDVADRSAVVGLTDSDALAAAIRRLQPTHVVAATDTVAADALAAAADSGLAEVVPSPRSVQLTADREGLRRLAADELGLPTAPFWFAGSLDELRAVTEHAGFPMVIKPVAASEGEGHSVVLRPDDVESAWQRAVSAGGRVAHSRVLAETLVEVDYKVTLLTVCGGGPDGRMPQFCPPIGRRQADDRVLEYWQPQPMSAIASDTARSIAARIVKALGGRGLFGVELMVKGDEVYFADVTVRPYDAALVTLRTQRLSGFELAARVVLGLATDAIMISPGAARLVHSSRETVDATAADTAADPVTLLRQALAVPESDAWLFGRDDPRHRLGVTLATAPDVPTARARAEQVAEVLGALWR